MSVADIIAMIETTIAGLEERLELAKQKDDLGEIIALSGKQASLMMLRIDILARQEAEA